jgi:hypothetical protein
MNPIAPDTQEMLDSLRAAVADTLERKQRLGQYAVVWQDGKPVRLNSAALVSSGHDKNGPGRESC